MDCGMGMRSLLQPRSASANGAAKYRAYRPRTIPFRTEPFIVTHDPDLAVQFHSDRRLRYVHGHGLPRIGPAEGDDLPADHDPARRADSPLNTDRLHARSWSRARRPQTADRRPRNRCTSSPVSGVGRTRNSSREVVEGKCAGAELAGVAMPQLWAGVDAGKTRHHRVVIDSEGRRLLSRRVANDEPEWHLSRSGENTGRRQPRPVGPAELLSDTGRHPPDRPVPAGDLAAQPQGPQGRPAHPSRQQLTGPDLSPHGSFRPKPLRRPREYVPAVSPTNEEGWATLHETRPRWGTAMAVPGTHPLGCRP